MPASTVKPLMALGSLASAQPMNDAWLNHNLPHSMSREFLRIFTCANLPEGTRFFGKPYPEAQLIAAIHELIAADRA